MKFFNFLSSIFDSVYHLRFCVRFRFHFRFHFRDSISVSGFRIPCFSAAGLDKLTCFMWQRVSSYSSDPFMLPVVSLITYRARFCLMSFAIKTWLLRHLKRILLCVLMHILMAKMAALKLGILNQETESRNEIRNQISMIEKYYIKIPWQWNLQNKDNSFIWWQSNLHWHK